MAIKWGKLKETFPREGRIDAISDIGHDYWIDVEDGTYITKGVGTNSKRFNNEKDAKKYIENLYNNYVKNREKLIANKKIKGQ